jgi:hypothetical protein
MTQISFEWKIEDLNTLCPRTGRKLGCVHEIVLGTEDDGRKFGPMPLEVAEAFVRARREQAADAMSNDGAIRIITS